MLKREMAFAVCGAVLVAGLVSVHAWNSSRTTRVTFSGPVALPGVTLGSGSYVFQLMNPNNTLDVVTVRAENTGPVYFTGFTRPIPRPTGAVQVVSLGEARAGSAPRVLAWYPEGESMGHQFIYRDAR